MATPSIQTLITQAQQVLNLQSSNEIRATLAAVLANANVGTPLNPNLTTQQLWDEFDEIVRQSTDDIMSIIVDQMMRMVFSPPAPGGAGADKQVIFNDMGVLAGDAGLVYNKTTDALTVAGLVTAGSATITGDLTVDTSTLKVDSTNDNVIVGATSAIGGGRFSVQADLSAKQGICVKNSAASYGASNNFIRFTNSTDATVGGITHPAVTSLGVWSVSDIQFLLSGAATTAMILNSTGLGIGDPPNRNLDVRKDQSAATIARVQNQSVNAAAYSELNLAASGNNWGIRTGSTAANSNRLEFVVDPSGTNLTAIALTSSGNVGIGVTPSAWTAFKVLQVGLGLIAASSGSSNARIFANTYYNGQYRYIANGAATEYEQDGYHAWKIAPSGTAGASAAVTSGQSYTVSVLGSSTLAQWQAFFSALTVLPTVGQAITATATGSIVGGGTVTQYITFTDAMTLDANGNLLVGTTTANGRVAVDTDLAVYNGMAVKNTGTTYGASSFFFRFINSSGVTAGSIQHTAVTTTNYSTTSDSRLKESKGISTDTSVIDNTIVRDFVWKADGSTDCGVFAQEAQSVKPRAISAGSDDLTEDGNIKTPWSVDYSKYVPDLIVYCQQLKKQVVELTARVQTLEAR